MTRVLRFMYSLAIAAFLVVAVILGTEVAFDEPTSPRPMSPDYSLAIRQFENDREDYYRDVSATAALVGMAAIVAGAGPI